MITCPKHKIPLKIRRDVKIRELAATCPFCKIEKRAALSDTTTCRRCSVTSEHG